MHDDQPMPVTLAIADCRLDLRVLGFRGRDGLNEVCRYDIDLVASDPHPDLSAWSGGDAFLCFGPEDRGIHGQIRDVVKHYAGASLSHYRLTLMPVLHRLDQHARRRVHENMTTPALIARLLDEHGLRAGDYSFDGLTGLYPSRAVRVQYEETDLQFLQRVCAQEGIHFRFRHSRHRHRLLFADDPASFPEHPAPLRFVEQGGEPALRHLAQHWSASCLQAQAPIQIRSLDKPARHASAATARDRHVPVNEPLDEPGPGSLADVEESLYRQRALRELERLRCARYQVRGVSDRPDMQSGLIVQVLGHPEALFNDQWLITRVEHSAARFEVLEGLPCDDIAAIVARFQAEAPDVQSGAPRQGYRNSFEALPWAMTYRPQRRHVRPGVYGEQPATVMDCPPDRPGRVPIRYDWQPARAPGGARQAWPQALVLRGTQAGLDTLAPGARVLVAHFDGDPERPVICGLENEQAQSTPLEIRLDGLHVSPLNDSLEVGHGQRLRVRARQDVKVHGLHGTVELNEHSILFSGPAAMQAFPWTQETGSCGAGPDLRLLRGAGPHGEPLARSAWYIVRMARPGLEHLPRIDPRQILFEGTTDAHGYLGLSPVQRRQLATLYNAEPQALCLAYPGHCLRLHDWLRDNWTERQRQAFRLSGL